MNNDKWTITEFSQERVRDWNITDRNHYTSLTALKRKAEQGDAKAQYDLAIRYVSGSGVGKNYEKAFYWYHKAAKQGHRSAQYALEHCYSEGIGTVKDLKQAKYWYEKATK